MKDGIRYYLNTDTLYVRLRMNAFNAVQLNSNYYNNVTGYCLSN